MIHNRLFQTAAVVSLFLAVSPILLAESGKKKEAKEEKTETAYEKLFKDKKVRTAENFLKLHMLDRDQLIFELPKDLIGRDFLITSAVEQTSDGGEASIGYIAPSSIHVTFEATDSLVVMKEVTAYRYSACEPEADKAVKKGHSGAIVATFPIAAQSPDSSAYVFDGTSYFTSYDKRLDPVDGHGSNSFDGMMSSVLSHQSEYSILDDIRAYERNMSILSYETYGVSKSLFGMTSGDGQKLTVLQRKSLLLLPEKTMRPRKADARIGVSGRSFVNYRADDRGAQVEWYANRWNMDKEHLVFHVDTLFTEPYAEAIRQGILKWNEAFAGIGRPDFIQVRDYPSDDPDFDANDIRFSCIKYEASPNTKIRSNVWVDPRSGEIFSAAMYIPFDIMTVIQSKAVMELGDAVASVQTARNTSPVLFEALQAMVTREIGGCLGLTSNLMASCAVPSDSLRSATYTREYGLSASIMDDVPFNYFAKSGDLQKGVRMVHTQIGPYDRYVVRWLYGTVPDAVTPEDEVPYLDQMIADSKKDKDLAYGREPWRGDARFGMDPRLVAGDLGDDPIRATREKISNLKFIITQLDQWIPKTDPKYTFRPQLNVRFLENSVYPFADLLHHVGGFYLNLRKDGDAVPSYEPVPKALQKEILEYFMTELEDLSWLDNTDIYRDLIFVRSFGDYFTSMLTSNLLSAVTRLNFAQTKSDDPYTELEAYDDVINHYLAPVKEGKPLSKNGLDIQRVLLGYTIAASNAVYRTPGGRGIDEKAPFEGFSVMPAVDFKVTTPTDHVLFSRLKEIRDIYAKGAKKTKDENLKREYRFFVMAIDRALE